MTLAATIKSLRAKAGLTQQQLADAIDVKQSYIGNLESGRNKALSPDTLASLATALGVPSDHFIPYLPQNAIATLVASGTLPDFGPVAAGDGVELEDVDPGARFDMRAEFPAGRCAVLHVRGDSVSGKKVFDGDLVVVRFQHDAERGDLVIARIEGRHVLKLFDPDGPRLWSVTRAKKTVVTVDPRAGVELIGRVVWVLRKL